MAYTLKSAGSKTRWTLDLVAEVLAAKASGKSAIEAFATVAQAHNLTLPASCTNKNATSVLWTLTRRFLKACDEGEVAALEVAQRLDLVTKTDEVASPE
jgi:hypothetical protein